MKNKFLIGWLGLLLAAPFLVLAEEPESIPAALLPLSQELGCETKLECKAAFERDFNKGIQLAEKYKVYDKDPAKKELLKSYKQEVIEKLSKVNAEDLDEKILEIAQNILKNKPQLARKLNVESQVIKKAEEFINRSNKTDDLERDLAEGKYPELGKTLDEAGANCLRAGSPDVCDEIAAQYFGPEGVDELARARNQRDQTEEYYKTKYADMTLATLDGKEIRGKQSIKNACDGAFKTGDLSLARACGQFAVKNGFAKEEDVAEGLKLLESLGNQAKPVNIDRCRENPEECQEFLPDEFKNKFKAFREMERIMTEALGFNPRQCQQAEFDPEVGQKCLLGSKKALPQLEALAVSNPEIRPILEDIKRKSAEGDRFNQEKERYSKEFNDTGGPGNCKSESDCFKYCSDPAHGPECIAFGARSGIFKANDAVKRFQKYNQNIRGDYQKFISPDLDDQTRDEDERQDVEEEFFEDEDFEDHNGERLDPRFDDGRQFSGVGPTPECFQAIQSGNFVKAKEVCNIPAPFYPREPDKSTNDQSYTDPYRKSPRPVACPTFAVRGDECKSQPGTVPDQDPLSCRLICRPQYRPVVDPPWIGATGTPDFKREICPRLPTVDSCPIDQEKVTTYSSPECGTYYACVPKKNVENDNWQSYACSKYGTGWHIMEGDTGHCYEPGMQNFYTKEGKLYSCASKPADIRAPGCTSSIGGGTPQCSNGKDDDGDGLVDYPADTGCYGKDDWDESYPSDVVGQCSANLKALLGEGCHQMSTDSSGKTVFCDGPMSKSAKEGDTASTPGCSYTGGGGSNANWAKTTWNFSDGLSESSYILNRTDVEYQNYLAPIRAQCLTIPKSKFVWKPGSGTQDNWREFGIPDCSGTGVAGGASSITPSNPATPPSCPSGQYWFYDSNGSGYCKSSTDVGGTGTSSWSCPVEVKGLLGEGCHQMSGGYFDSSMTRYVVPGSVEVKSCANTYAQGCSGSTGVTPPTSYRAQNSTAQLGNLLDRALRFFKGGR